jgi:hypothetical protein
MISEVEKTKSYVFLTPMLELDPVFARKDLIINTYLADTNHTNLTNIMFIQYLYDTKGNAMSRLEAWLKKHDCYIGNYDPDKYSTIYYFKIPEKYQDDYTYILNGQYSKISKQLKYKILKFFNASIENDLYKILFKDEKYKLLLEEKLNAELPYDAELASKINFEKETFKEEYYLTTEKILKLINVR